MQELDRLRERVVRLAKLAETFKFSRAVREAYEKARAEVAALEARNATS